MSRDILTSEQLPPIGAMSITFDYLSLHIIADTIFLFFTSCFEDKPIFAASPEANVCIQAYILGPTYNNNYKLLENVTLHHSTLSLIGSRQQSRASLLGLSAYYS